MFRRPSSYLLFFWNSSNKPKAIFETDGFGQPINSAHPSANKGDGSQGYYSAPHSYELNQDSASTTFPGAGQSPFRYQPPNTYNAQNPYKPVGDENVTVDGAPHVQRTTQEKRKDEIENRKKMSVVMSPDGIPLASTVICMTPEYKLLFIKRSKQMKFMPNLFAFPGGKVDPEDLETAKNNRGVTNAMNRTPGLSRLMERVACLRELNEELGVAVDSSGGVIFEDPDRNRMRDFSVIDKLVPFQRWITPPQESRRFDTMFFLLPVQKDADKTVKMFPNEGEIAEARWLTPYEAHELHVKPDSGFKLPPPTQVIIDIMKRNYRDPLYFAAHYRSTFDPKQGRNPMAIEPEVQIDPKTGDFLMGLRERELLNEYPSDYKSGAKGKKYLLGDFGYEIPPGFLKGTGGNVRNPNPKMFVVVKSSDR
jgi:8-oxo-dGTP pyrophosphatase MutT (NUDIX family)